MTYQLTTAKIWDGAAWVDAAGGGVQNATVSATTGSPTITTDGAATIYTFTGSGTMTFDAAGMARFLLVGGGGGGSTPSPYANRNGGGAGAGGITDKSVYVPETGTYTVTIGVGGAVYGLGGDTRFYKSGLEGFLVAPGGGNGGVEPGNSSERGGSAGGKGNGAGGISQAIATFGNNPGSMVNIDNNIYGGAGGGGGGAVGGNGTSVAGGVGGAGLYSDISGTSTPYAGGGGGGRKPWKPWSWRRRRWGSWRHRGGNEWNRKHRRRRWRSRNFKWWHGRLRNFNSEDWLMAHYAHVIDGNVVQVHVVANEVITDDDGVEQEALGQTFLADLWGYDPNQLVQCSYNGNMRGVYPGPGYTYDETLDNFIPPQPVP